MPTKPLSKRVGFESALVLTTNYSSNPSISGECQLAVRWQKSRISVWKWVDEWGAEVLFHLPPNASWREILEEALSCEAIPAAVNLFAIHITGDRSPLGQMLSLVLADDVANRMGAQLLMRLPDKTLIRLANRRGGLLSSKVLEMVDRILAIVTKHDVDIKELQLRMSLDTSNVSAIARVFRLSLAASIKQRRNEERGISSSIAPFTVDIEKILIRWSAGKHRSRYPGGSMLPPWGHGQLDVYLREYVLAHASLPTGKHTIPEGTMLGNRIPPFVVDFDELTD